MKKILKSYGNTTVIVLNTEDLKIYNLKPGDIVDVKLIRIKKEKRK